MNESHLGGPAARAPRVWHPAGVARRLASAGYDLLLLLGVLFVATALVTVPTGLAGIDLTSGWPRRIFQLYLLAMILGYYLYFWSEGRQTLGMRAWRLELRRADGGVLDVRGAAWRLLWVVLTLAPAGIGLWWQWCDRERLTAYDRLAATRLWVVKHSASPREAG